jgi:hypothetical protein
MGLSNALCVPMPMAFLNPLLAVVVVKRQLSSPQRWRAARGARICPGPLASQPRESLLSNVIATLWS